MSPLKVVSLNVEGNRHVERVFSFLEESNADVICLQEVFETEFQLLGRILQMHGMFAPVASIDEEYKNISGTPGIEGVGLLTRLPFRNLSEHYYLGAHHPIPSFVLGDMTSVNRVLVTATVTKDDADYTVGTTHFTWTPNGETNDDQRRDIGLLFKVLDKIPEIILIGDLNAPRGGETWAAFAARYKDNIPIKYKSSLDSNISKFGDKVKVMVDGFFTTPEYLVKNVELIPGISDHCAITGNVWRPRSQFEK